MTSSINRRPLIAVLVFWIALWTVIVATWMYDSQGYTVGMPGPVFLLTLLGPLLAGVVLGGGKATLRRGSGAGMIGGALFGAANMVGQLVWGAVLQLRGRIPPDATAAAGGRGLVVLELVEFTVLFTVSGLILGLVGGLIGAAVSRMARR